MRGRVWRIWVLCTVFEPHFFPYPNFIYQVPRPPIPSDMVWVWVWMGEEMGLWEQWGVRTGQSMSGDTMWAGLVLAVQERVLAGGVLCPLRVTEQPAVQPQGCGVELGCLSPKAPTGPGLVCVELQ